MPIIKRKDRWEKICTDALKGKTIEQVRYLTDAELQQLGWSSRAGVLVFTDGTELIASADDEGNGPGAYFTNLSEAPVIPIVRE